MTIRDQEAEVSDDISVTPPMFGERPCGDQTCGRWLGETNCGKPATWHELWDTQGQNALTCDEHHEEARQRWAVYDTHRLVPMCTMPETNWISSWEEPPGRCVWVVSVETMNAALAAEHDEVRYPVSSYYDDPDFADEYRYLDGDGYRLGARRTGA